jgi:hypothetical protein
VATADGSYPTGTTLRQVPDGGYGPAIVVGLNTGSEVVCGGSPRGPCPAQHVDPTNCEATCQGLVSGHNARDVGPIDVEILDARCRQPMPGACSYPKICMAFAKLDGRCVAMNLDFEYSGGQEYDCALSVADEGKQFPACTPDPAAPPVNSDDGGANPTANAGDDASAH